MLVPVDRLRVLVDRELDRKNNFINFTLYILNYDPELSIETKRKEEEEKKKRMKNRCDKGTFLFFFLSFFILETNVEDRKNKGGEGKAETVTIAKITESRLFSIQ